MRGPTPHPEPSLSSGAVADAIGEALKRQRAGQAFGEAGQALKALLDSRRKSLASEVARGDVAAARFASLVEEAVAALYEAGARAPGAADKFAICAVGGFGRGLLAPYSDVDLLYLHGGRVEDCKSLMDFVNYPLWDAGLKVGYAIHAPQGAVALAEKDLVARTSYLDARLVSGSEALFRDFRQRYEKLRKRTKKAFYAAKNDEREERHDKSEQSRFLAEPDVKDGKGGLRDLHTMRWHYKYEYDFEIDDARARKRLLGPEDLKAFRRAERFLWSVRFQLHALRGRADEKAAFEIQPALAERLGYADRSGATAAERLMRHYFVNAMEIGRLTRLFSSRLEEEKNKLSPKSLRILPKALGLNEVGAKANLKLQGGRLHFDNAARARREPADLFALFRAFAKRPDFDFHPDALAVVAASLKSVTGAAREDPRIAAIFMAALVEAKDKLKLLRVMAETGLLGKYLPTFGKIIGRIEYGLYRRFSIDENVYQSIGVLAEIERGEARDRHPIATEIVGRQRSLAPYYLAALLHETGWAMRGEPIEAVEKLILRIMRRLGLDETDASVAAWCAARHLLMVRTAARRNLAEPATIARFAEEVGDPARLDMLLVLSVCHLRVVGAYSWDDWTRRQLSELYFGAAAWLAGGEDALRRRLGERAREARAAAGAYLAAEEASAGDPFLQRLSDAMFRAIEPAVVARMADLARAASAGGASSAVSARISDGAVEALVYADDRPGLLADLAGAVAAAGASVRTVQAMTHEGKATDVFLIQSADGAPIDDGDLVARLHAKLLAAATAPPTRRDPPSRRIGDRRAIFAIAPQVRLFSEESEDFLIVEAEGRDRPGLLFELCAALADAGVTIASAHVATYGARAIDAFYLQDESGAKPVAGPLLRRIEDALLVVLAGGGQGRNPLTVAP